MESTKSLYLQMKLSCALSKLDAFTTVIKWPNNVLATSTSSSNIISNGDQMERCGWVGVDETYLEYHDQEWGVPEYDSRTLWEKLILDGFQAGLPCS